MSEVSLKSGLSASVCGEVCDQGGGTWDLSVWGGGGTTSPGRGDMGPKCLGGGELRHQGGGTWDLSVWGELRGQGGGFEFEWGVYSLSPSSSKAIFRARTYNCIAYSVR